MLRKTVATCAGVLLLLSGCGSDPATPAEAVPELADTLSSVDDALADRRFADARRSLNTLVQTTVDAREAGELEPEQADRVLSAAARLLSALPAPRRPAAEETTPAPPSGQESEDDWEKKQEEWQKKLEEEQKKLEEEQKKLEEEAEKEEEDGDDGHNSGNGPDDGHGN